MYDPLLWRFKRQGGCGCDWKGNFPSKTLNPKLQSARPKDQLEEEGAGEGTREDGEVQGQAKPS